MIRFDWWYGKRKPQQCKAVVTFYPNEGIYRGNLYHEGKCVGDFTSDNSVEIEKHWPEIFK